MGVLVDSARRGAGEAEAGMPDGCPVAPPPVKRGPGRPRKSPAPERTYDTEGRPIFRTEDKALSWGERKREWGRKKRWEEEVAAGRVVEPPAPIHTHGNLFTASAEVSLVPRLNRFIPILPTVKQQAFLLLGCMDAFFGGATRGGKSYTALAAALQFVDVPGYSALLLRNTYPELSMPPEGLIPIAKEWLKGTGAEWSADTYSFIFPSKAVLSFGYLEGPDDHLRYRGNAYQYIGIDEAVTVRQHQAEFLFSRLQRPSHGIASEIPLRYRCYSNPPTHGMAAVRGKWVKERYIDPETRRKGTVFMPANLEDNPFVDQPSYEQALRQLDPVTYAQLRHGNWDVRIKGRLFDRDKCPHVDAVPGNLKVIKTVRWWDLASTEPMRGGRMRDGNRSPDFTCGVRMSKTGDGRFWMEHVSYWQAGPGETDMRLRDIAVQDTPRVAVRCGQEGGSGGKRDIFHLRRDVFPGFDFMARPERDDKYSRAKPLSAAMDAGLVSIIKAPWNNWFWEQAEVFPDGGSAAHDDGPDAASGAYSELAQAYTGPTIRIIGG